MRRKSVKAIQSRKGSRQGYASMDERGSWETRITPDLAEFIGRQASVLLGTASAGGQPYILEAAEVTADAGRARQAYRGLNQ